MVCHALPSDGVFFLTGCAMSHISFLLRSGLCLLGMGAMGGCDLLGDLEEEGAKGGAGDMARVLADMAAPVELRLDMSLDLARMPDAAPDSSGGGGDVGVAEDAGTQGDVGAQGVDMAPEEVPRRFEGKPLLWAAFSPVELKIDGLRDAAYEERYGYTFMGPGSDNRVTVSAAWTSGRLYLLYEVTDRSAHVFETARIWQCDCMDAYVDTGRDKGSDLDKNDLQVILNFRGETFAARGGKMSMPPGAAYGFSVSSVGSYMLEVSLPWEDFLLAPGPGRLYGVHFAATDCDLTAQDALPYGFTWDADYPMEAQEDWPLNQVPLHWGTLKLVE